MSSKEMKNRSLSIKARLTAVIFSVLIITVSVNSLINTFYFRSAYKKALEEKSYAVGQALRRTVNNSLRYFPLDSFAEMNPYLVGLVQSNEGISYCFIADREGKVLYHSEYRHRKSSLNREAYGELYSARRIPKTTLAIGEYYESLIPIIHHKEAVGTIHIGIKQEIINSKIRDNLIQTLVVLMLALGVCMFLFYHSISRIIIVPISQLRTAIAEIISRKKFERHIEVKNRDEIGDLGILFNQMTDELKRYLAQLLNRTEELKREIAHREDVEIALRENEEKFRSLVETTSDWVWEVDHNVKYTYVSPQVRDILGYEPAEVLGRSPFDLMPSGEAGRLKDTVREIFDQRGPIDYLENTNVHKDGRLVVLETNGVPIFSSQGKFLGYRGIDRDITGRKHAQEELDKHRHHLEDLVKERTEELRESRDYFQKIINSIADPIFVKDRQHHWVLLNQAHAEMFGIPTEEMLGKSDRDYFSKKEADVFWERDELVFKTGKEDINEEQWTDTKEVTYTIVTKKTLYTDKHGRKFIVGIIRDITELKKAEKELREAMAIKSKFTSMVSHELRTPLAAIKTGIALVLDGMAGQINKDQEEFLAIVRRNVDRLGRLINDVLDFQKLDSGRMEFKMEANDINGVIKETHETMKSLATGKGLKLNLKLNRMPWVKFDKDRIQQVLGNLVNNAIKFTDKGEVTIATRKEGGNIQVRVIDTGIGIEKEDVGRIFHSFEQVKRTKGRKIIGTGLGLAICKEIIERHKGRIWVESKIGKGSTFHFTLPITGGKEA